MARQRTFDLIPTTLVHPNSNKPPMTSKQVKREYLKANQKDRLTRAEQRLLEAKELRRLKLEYSREKASAKARATKENKISKALIEAQLRKKSGLPPKPNRSRSQTTISFFTGYDCPIVINRPEIKTKADKDLDIHEKQIDEDVKEDVNKDNMKDLSTKKDNYESESSEDEFGGFPFCSQLEMMVTSIDSKEKSLKYPIPQILSNTERELSKLNSQILDLQPNLSMKQNNEDNLMDILQDSPRSVLTRKHGSEVSNKCSKPDVENLNSKTQAQKCTELSIKSVSQFDLCGSSSTTVENCLNFSQSLISVKDRTLLSCEMSRLQEFPSPDAGITLPRTIAEDNNTSVVDLEFSNEFSEDFPSSPTQEIGDFHNDDDDIDAADFPSNTQIMTEINSSESTRPENCNLRVSQKTQLSKIKNNHRTGSLIKTAENPCAEAGSQATIKQQDYFDDFICTQDLVVLSQEISRINASTPNNSKPEHRSPQEKVKEKKRFFEEKEEDLMKAALYESKMMASKSNSSKLIRQELELSIDTIFPSDHCTTSISSPGTDYGADDFAGNEWEELSALCEPKLL